MCEVLLMAATEAIRDFMGYRNGTASSRLVYEIQKLHKYSKAGKEAKRQDTIIIIIADILFLLIIIISSRSSTRLLSSPCSMSLTADGHAYYCAMEMQNRKKKHF